MTVTTSTTPRWWLFSPRIDVAAFLGSALLAFLALAVGWKLGLLEQGDTPDWAWISAVLLVDVAHVWATGFRTYFDPSELARRPVLFVATPLGCLLGGVVLYSFGPAVFWRTMAYLAVYHFVRQQYGWVALYRRKLHESDGWPRWLDTLTIYAATIYPLIYWHCHLPRGFWWFIPGDFGSLPGAIMALATPLYWLLMAAYWTRSASLWLSGHPNPGKDMVVLTTAVCWYVGIITFNSDYAFTVTNVLIHGIPYFVLVFWHSPPRRWPLWRALPVFVLSLWALAYAEEMFWDRAVWHERGWLFGGAWTGLPAELLVPLLAVPQLTHYLLDGFIWKRRSNAQLKEMVDG